MCAGGAARSRRIGVELPEVPAASTIAFAKNSLVNFQRDSFGEFRTGFPTPLRPPRHLCFAQDDMQMCK